MRRAATFVPEFQIEHLRRKPLRRALQGFDITSWNAVFAPAGTPRPIIATLNRILADMANSASFRERSAKLGFDAFGSTPEELGAFTVSELAKWKKLIQSADIQPE